MRSSPQRPESFIHGLEASFQFLDDRLFLLHELSIALGQIAACIQHALQVVQEAVDHVSTVRVLLDHRKQLLDGLTDGDFLLLPAIIVAVDAVLVLADGRANGLEHDRSLGAAAIRIGRCGSWRWAGLRSFFECGLKRVDLGLKGFFPLRCF